MKVEVENLSPVKISMSIEVPPDVVSKEEAAVLGNYARKAKIPGFRPGKAPLSVIRSRFGHEVDDDVRERMITRCYVQAAKEKGFRPLGDPILDDVEYSHGESLRFKTTFEVLPEFELKGYKGIEVPRVVPRNEDGEVDKALEELRQSRTTLEAFDGKAETGHVIVADIEGTPEDGEEFKRDRMFIELGAPDNLPEFDEKLVGAAPGDECEFPVEYPKEYSQESLAGKTVQFRVRVHEVKTKVVPELDDEFAKDLGDFDNLEALHTKLSEDLLSRKKEEAERDVRQRLLDKVLLENPFVLPEVLVDEETRNRLEEIARSMLMRGIDPEKTEVDWREVRQKQEEPARKSVHARLILDAVAGAESLEVGDDEVDRRIRHDAAHMKEKPEKLRKNLEKHGGLQALKNQLLREKALDLIASVANIHDEE